MKKIKIPTQKIGKFLREIVVIVIGVAITLLASHWVTNRNTEKDMALYLDAIKLELEENVKILKEANGHSVQVAVNYSEYLRSHDKKTLNLDSLLFYRDRTVFNAYSVMVKNNAFEMFKSSGNMRLVKNKELLLSLWDTYAKLDDLKRGIELSQQLKMEEMKKYFYLNSSPNDELLKNPPMYDFYVNMYVPHMHRTLIDYTLKHLNETISMFK